MLGCNDGDAPLPKAFRLGEADERLPALVHQVAADQSGGGHIHQVPIVDEASVRPVEIVNLRLRMVAAAESYTPAYCEPVPGDGRAACYAERPLHFGSKSMPARHYRREGLTPGDAIRGPAIITEYTSATVLPPGCTAHVDGYRNLVISVEESA